MHMAKLVEPTVASAALFHMGHIDRLKQDAPDEVTIVNIYMLATEITRASISQNRQFIYKARTIVRIGKI